MNNNSDKNWRMSKTLNHFIVTILNYKDISLQNITKLFTGPN